MTRQEHLDWAKARAMEYIDAGDLTGAFTSFASDVAKHDETKGIRTAIAMLGMPLLMGGQLTTANAMRSHIQGYN